jgi:hypothetical protein
MDMPIRIPDFRLESAAAQAAGWVVAVDSASDFDS